MDENLASATIEILDRRVAKVTGSASSRALNRRRRIKENKKGVLTDITEVIHPDQFDIVQIDHAGPLVIEGGPGTGKTVVALERIAYLILNNSGGLFGSDAVLVVGPTTAYTEYVKSFLPGLGIGEVRNEDFNSVCALRLNAQELAEVAEYAEESDAMVRTKNSANMIRLIQGSVWPEVESFGIEVTVNKNLGQRESRSIDSDEVEHEINALRRQFQEGAISYKQAQDNLRNRLHAIAILETRSTVGKSARTIESRRAELFDLWLLKIGQYSQQERQKWRRTLDSPASGRIKRAMTGVMSEYYQRDIEVAIDLIAPNLEVDVAALRDALDELEVEKKRPGALRDDVTNESSESKVVVLEEVTNDELQRVQSGGSLSKIEQLANQLLPNRSAITVARSICSGDKKLFERVLGKNGVALAERLSESAAARSDKRRYVWTNADLPILSELKFLIEGNEGVPRFSHVVIDEAQDLTRLQARVLSRFVRNSQVSLVGDLNQATRASSLASWNAVADELDIEEPRVESLRHNYRVPQNIYDYARLYLTEDDRVETPTCDIDGGEIEVVQVPLVDTMSVLDKKLRDLSTDGARVVVISDDSRTKQFVEDLGIPNTVVLDPEESKGLEVDHAIVVSPNRWFSDSARLNRLMYVVLTRATKSVSIIQHEPDRFGILLPSYDSFEA
jgi:DNA helicase IV